MWTPNMLDSGIASAFTTVGSYSSQGLYITVAVRHSDCFLRACMPPLRRPLSTYGCGSPVRPMGADLLFDLIDIEIVATQVLWYRRVAASDLMLRYLCCSTFLRGVVMYVLGDRLNLAGVTKLCLISTPEID